MIEIAKRISYENEDNCGIIACHANQLMCTKRRRETKRCWMINKARMIMEDDINTSTDIIIITINIDKCTFKRLAKNNNVN